MTIWPNNQEGLTNYPGWTHVCGCCSWCSPAPWPPPVACWCRSGCLSAAPPPSPLSPACPWPSSARSATPTTPRSQWPSTCATRLGSSAFPSTGSPTPAWRRHSSSGRSGRLRISRPTAPCSTTAGPLRWCTPTWAFPPSSSASSVRLRTSRLTTLYCTLTLLIPQWCTPPLVSMVQLGHTWRRSDVFGSWANWLATDCHLHTYKHNLSLFLFSKHQQVKTDWKVPTIGKKSIVK